jgi:hypothetical protein
MSITTQRVPDHTAPAVNERIDRMTEENVHRFAQAEAREIQERLHDLEREWDIERAIEMMSSSLMLTGMGLAATFHRRWLLLSGVVAGFLLQHATQGWCPPVPVLRRLGFRTASEIDEERYALKALRGDFEDLSEKTVDPVERARMAVEAAR